MPRSFYMGEKPLECVSSSKNDFRSFPDSVRPEMGKALGLAQFGGKHPSAKPWTGQGPGVFELVEDHDGDTYRAVYTVRFQDVVYVLHAFQKKSPSRIRTAQLDIDMIERRLRLAQQDYQARMAYESAETMNEADETITRGTSNVFADLGYPDAGEPQTKLRLAYAINGVIA